METINISIDEIIRVYESIQGTGNSPYQNRFYYRQLKKVKDEKSRLGN